MMGSETQRDRDRERRRERRFEVHGVASWHIPECPVVLEKEGDLSVEKGREDIAPEGPGVGRDGPGAGRDGLGAGRDGPGAGRDGPGVGRDSEYSPASPHYEV